MKEKIFFIIYRYFIFLIKFNNYFKINYIFLLVLIQIFVKIKKIER